MRTLLAAILSLLATTVWADNFCAEYVMVNWQDGLGPALTDNHQFRTKWRVNGGAWNYGNLHSFGAYGGDYWYDYIDASVDEEITVHIEIWTPPPNNQKMFTSKPGTILDCKGETVYNPGLDGYVLYFFPKNFRIPIGP